MLVAEEQTAGRGRLDRTWTAPARSGLFFSVYLEPGDVPAERWGWLPLLAGVATATGLARAAGVDTALKWPNDLLVTVEGEERKAGGILAERAGDGVVVGIGLNVSLRAEELPAPTAASLALAGAVSTDRETLLRAVLRSLEHWYGQWRAANGDAAASGLQEAYAAGCATLGRTVRAQLPGDRTLVAEAVAIDGDGRLILSTDDGLQEPVSAGDIVHLRGWGRAGLRRRAGTTATGTGYAAPLAGAAPPSLPAHPNRYSGHESVPSWKPPTGRNHPRPRLTQEHSRMP